MRKELRRLSFVAALVALAASLVVGAGIEIKKEKPTNTANRFWHHEAGEKQYFLVPVAKFSPTLAANINKALTVVIPDAYDNIKQETEPMDPLAFVVFGEAMPSQDNSENPFRLISNTGKELPMASAAEFAARFERKLHDLRSVESLGATLAREMPNVNLTDTSRRGKEKTIDAQTLKKFSDMARKPLKFVEGVAAAVKPAFQDGASICIVGIKGRAKANQVNKVIIRLGGAEAEMQQYNYYPDLKQVLHLDAYGASR